nr:PREDICTED: regenerating islet-derived protein 4 [Anolis carolinensis]|eukprot:XP_008122213.1 PREDICTED: regenerating islet-derived protein 4 [Anolis carolinensis]
MGLVVCFGLCLLGCLAFSPSVEGVRNQSLPRPRSPCPPGAFYYQRMCYEYLNDALSWEDAENSCQNSRGGHLASIQSLQDEKDISNYIRKATQNYLVWIGFHAELVSSKLKWGWSDGFAYLAGSALWDGRRPSNTDISKLCIALHNVQDSSASARWAQVDCSNRYPYLCKYRAAY